MLIDAHAHIDLFAQAGENALESALREIAAHDIFTISNSIDPDSYQRNLEISRSCDRILPIFGVHPWYASRYIGQWDLLSTAIQSSPMLGEIGLDTLLVKDASQYPDQRRMFEFFLAAARDQDKIVHLHAPGAEREVLACLQIYRVRRGVVHWYSGPLDTLRDFIAAGLYFTVGVEVLTSPLIQAIACEIPLERLLTETDNPDGPKSVLGRAGTPALLNRVIEKTAQVRGTSSAALIQAVHQNLQRLFEDDPRLQQARARLLDPGS